MNSLRMRILRSQLIVIALTMVLFFVSVMLITPRVHDRLLRNEMQHREYENNNDDDESDNAALQPFNDPNDGIPPLIRGDVLRFENLYRNAVFTAMAISGTLSVVVAVVISVALARLMTQPIQRLIVASRRIAAGNFQHIETQPGADEINALTNQFNHMATALRDAEQRRAALIGDVAHELRTPLASIGGYAEGLLDGVVVPNDKTYAIIRDEAGRMQRLVDDLQALSRAEAGTLTLYPTQVDLQQLVTRAVGLLDGQTAATGVTLTQQHQQKSELVTADADRMVQVILNLLTNAVRASKAGQQIRIATGHDANAVWCTVADEGIGIDAAHLGHIFERFYRVDPSRARSTGGSGVGLTIARAICEAHGGTLTAHSDGLGRGATFTITLPRDAAS